MPEGDAPGRDDDIRDLDYPDWHKTPFKDGPVIFSNSAINARITVERTTFRFGRESYLVTRHDREDGGEMWPKAQRTADDHDAAKVVYEEMENAERRARG